MEHALEGYIFKAFPALLSGCLAWSEWSMQQGAVHEAVFKGVTGSGRVVHLHGLEKDFDRQDVRGL